MNKALAMGVVTFLGFAMAGCMSVPKPIQVVDPASAGYQMERSAISSWKDAARTTFAGVERFYAVAARGPEGSRLAFIAKTGTQEMAIVDGKREQAYDEVSDLAFSQDGRHYAYTARNGAKMRVVLDGTPQMEFDEVGVQEVGPMLKSDNAISTTSTVWYPYYLTISRWIISFTEDGKHSLYAGRNGKEWTVVVDGKALPGFEGTLQTVPQFSHDAQHVLYVVAQGQQALGLSQRTFVFIDGQPIAQSDRIFGPFPKFDPEGQIDYFGGNEEGMIERIKLAPQGK